MRFFIVIFLAINFLTSCCLILGNRKQKVTFITNNKQAEVYLDNVLCGKGENVIVKVRKDFLLKDITVKTPGLVPQNKLLSVYNKTALFYVGLAFGGVPGLFDDGPKSYKYPKEVVFTTSDSLFSQMEKSNNSLSFTDLKIKNVQFKVKEYSGNIKKRRFELDPRLFDKSDYKSDLSAWKIKFYAKSTIDSLEKMILNEKYLTDHVSKINTAVYNIDSSKNLLYCRIDIDNLVLLQHRVSPVSKDAFNLDTCFFTYSGDITFFIDNKFGKNEITKTIKVISGDYRENSEEICFDFITKILNNIYINPEVQTLLKSAISIKPSDYFLIDQKNIVSTLKEAVKSTVTIKTKNGHGSGFCVGNGGEIITNAHVLGDETEIEVIMNSGETYKATVLCISKERDLALLKIDHQVDKVFKLTENIKPEVGQVIYAIGTPISLELGQTVSKGVYSRQFSKDDLEFYQTDASINSGNSGGPVVDKEGNLIGVVVAKNIEQGTEGVGYCIPLFDIVKSLNITLK